MKSLRKTKLVSLVLFISLIFACFAFPTSVVAEDIVYDDQYWADLTNAVAEKLGVSPEDIWIDTNLIRDLTDEEYEFLQAYDSLSNDFDEDMVQDNANLRNSCPPHSLGNAQTIQVRYWGSAGSYCYYWINAIVRNCTKCSYIDIAPISDPVYVNHFRPNGLPCIYCGT